jgi:hypothetical protein
MMLLKDYSQGVNPTDIPLYDWANAGFFRAPEYPSFTEDITVLYTIYSPMFLLPIH